jgi:hypothetical protein
VTGTEPVTPSLAKQVLSQLSYTSQLARVGRPSGSLFVRLRGSGGDGGVECYADLTDDTRAAGVEKAVEHDGDGGAVAQQFSLNSVSGKGDHPGVIARWLESRISRSSVAKRRRFPSFPRDERHENQRRNGVCPRRVKNDVYQQSCQSDQWQVATDGGFGCVCTQ